MSPRHSPRSSLSASPRLARAPFALRSITFPRVTATVTRSRGGNRRTPYKLASCRFSATASVGVLARYKAASPGQLSLPPRNRAPSVERGSRRRLTHLNHSPRISTTATWKCPLYRGAVAEHLEYANHFFESACGNEIDGGGSAKPRIRRSEPIAVLMRT